MGLLTSRIQFLGLHSQVTPGSDFSVYFFLVVNIPLLVYLEEPALVAGPADEVSARGERESWLSIALGGVHIPRMTDRALRDLFLASFSVLFSLPIAPHHPEGSREAR